MTLDKFGRITVPKSIREHLGITTETPLEIEETDDSVIIRVAHRQSPTVKKYGLLVYTGAAAGDLDKTIEQIRNERLKDI